MLHILIKFHYVTFGPSHKPLNTFWLTYFPQATFTTSRPIVMELTSNTPGGVQVFPTGVEAILRCCYRVNCRIHIACTAVFLPAPATPSHALVKPR